MLRGFVRKLTVSATNGFGDQIGVGRKARGEGWKKGRMRKLSESRIFADFADGRGF